VVGNKYQKKDPVLVEIGPRFVLNPIRIFAGSFGGATLWENAHYVSPNQQRALLKKRKAGRFAKRVQDKRARTDYIEATQPPKDELADVFTSETLV